MLASLPMPLVASIYYVQDDGSQRHGIFMISLTILITLSTALWIYVVVSFLQLFIVINNTVKLLPAIC